MDDLSDLQFLPPIVPVEQYETEDAVLIADNLKNVRVIVSIGLAIMLTVPCTGQLVLSVTEDSHQLDPATLHLSIKRVTQK